MPPSSRGQFGPCRSGDRTGTTRGVALRSEQDRLIVTTASPGWVGVRVPWDPWWSGAGGVPLKGGPGHMVMTRPPTVP